MTRTIVYTLLAIVLTACNGTLQGSLDCVLPIPKQTIAEKGIFATDKGVKVKTDRTNLIRAIEQAGFATDTAGKNSISLICRDSIEGITSPEGYRIRITPEEIEIEATTECGLFYGAQTISQLNKTHGHIPMRHHHRRTPLPLPRRYARRVAPLLRQRVHKETD